MEHYPHTVCHSYGMAILTHPPLCPVAYTRRVGQKRPNIWESVAGIVNLSSTHTVCQSGGMNTLSATTKYKNHRFPVEIISHAVWLYFRFCLSFRDVEELLFERGVGVTYETIRKWCRKFGQQYANQLRRRRPRLGDKWHMDEVFLTIKGEHHYLGRAVDQDGNVLDSLVQRRRNKEAAQKCFRKLLKGLTYVPRMIITDKLKSYGAAKREILPGVRTSSAPLSQQPRRELASTQPLARVAQAGSAGRCERRVVEALRVVTRVHPQDCRAHRGRLSIEECFSRRCGGRGGKGRSTKRSATSSAWNGMPAEKKGSKCLVVNVRGT